MTNENLPFTKEEIISRLYDLGVKPLSMEEGVPQYNQDLIKHVYEFAANTQTKSVKNVFEHIASQLDLRESMQWYLQKESDSPPGMCSLITLSYQIDPIIVIEPKTIAEVEQVEEAAKRLFEHIHYQFIALDLPIAFPKPLFELDDAACVQHCRFDGDYLLKLVLHNENVANNALDAYGGLKALH
jgi:hypothetical protein